jgi:hypothetical protein
MRWWNGRGKRKKEKSRTIEKRSFCIVVLSEHPRNTSVRTLGVLAEIWKWDQPLPSWWPTYLRVALGSDIIKYHHHKELDTGLMTRFACVGVFVTGFVPKGWAAPTNSFNLHSWLNKLGPINGAWTVRPSSITVSRYYSSCFICFLLVTASFLLVLTQRTQHTSPRYVYTALASTNRTKVKLSLCLIS